MPENVSPESKEERNPGHIRGGTDEEREAHGKMTREEAGRRGGEKTARTHGSEFYSEIGRKGGEAVSQNRQHMSEIGRKGGEHSHQGEGR